MERHLQRQPGLAAPAQPVQHPYPRARTDQIGQQRVPAAQRNVLIALPDWHGDRHRRFWRALTPAPVHVQGAVPQHSLLRRVGRGKYLPYPGRQSVFAVAAEIAVIVRLCRVHPGYRK